MEPNLKTANEQSDRYIRDYYGLTIRKQVQFKDKNKTLTRIVAQNIECVHGFEDWFLAGIRKIYDNTKKILELQSSAKFCQQKRSYELWVLKSKFKQEKDRYEFDDLPVKFRNFEKFKSTNTIVLKTQKEITARMLSNYPRMKIFALQELDDYVQKNFSVEAKELCKKVRVGVASYFCKKRRNKDVEKCLKSISLFEDFSLKEIDKNQLSSQSRVIMQISMYQVFKGGETKTIIKRSIATINTIMSLIATPATLVPIDNLGMEDNLYYKDIKLSKTAKDSLITLPYLQALDNSKNELKKLKKNQKLFFQRLKEGVIMILQEALNNIQESHELKEAKEKLELASFFITLKEKENISNDLTKASDIFLRAKTLFSQCIAVAQEYGEHAMQTLSKNPDTHIELQSNFLLLLSQARYIDLKTSKRKPRKLRY